MGCIFGKSINNTNINGNFKIDENINTINILYVEDSNIYFFLVDYILSKYIDRPINFIHTKTIRESYDHIKTNKYDIVFIDRELNDGEMGDDLIDRIITEKLVEPNKIVIISYLEDLNDIKKYLNMGVFYFLKPLDVKKFIETIKKIFNNI